VLASPRDRSSRRRRLDLAWERFVQHGELADVRPEIARSWTRAREVYGIDPALARAPLAPVDDLAARRERDDTWEVAEPILAEFSARLRGTGHALAFFDAAGVMLSIGGDADTIAAVQEINLCPGASWREEVAGTNGSGTSLVEHRATEVFASEHFVAAWQRWTSVGAPIAAPRRGELAGLIELTGSWDAPEPQGLVAATAIAALVEERLGARQHLRDEVIRYALRAARGSGDALLAVDARGRVLQANGAARGRLSLEDGELPRAARERLVAALRASDAASDEDLVVEWPGAAASPGAACSIVTHGGRPIGALLRVAAPPARPIHAGAPARARPSARYGFEAILGASPRLRGAVGLAEIAARNDLPVVLHGESGTGKELFAHGIHGASVRAAAPLVVVNCGAIPAALVEAELFGYEPGTFTGGQREGKAGKLEEAHGGTLFLDEVSELPPQAQTALLRAVQECEVVRLGGSKPRRVDVRIVSATNRRLTDEVNAGRFRQDLFFRLNVLHIDIPPLRERAADVPLLARAFLADAEERLGRSGLALSREAVAALEAHAWRGNVRELRNVILRAAAVAAGSVIEPSDLALFGRGTPIAPARAPVVLHAPPGAAPPGGAAEPRRDAAPGAEPEGPERDELVAALDACGWNIARTATTLGVSRQALYRRLRRFGITR
jgi:transcriptional regulator of acetoin/glycerol metabolism